MRILLVVSLTTGLAVAQRPSPAPPSTGREMPQAERRVLSPEQQQLMLKKGLAEFAREGDCAGVYNALTIGVLGGEKPLPLTAETQPVYSALAVCASKTGHHLSALRYAADLYKLDAQSPLAYLVPESE